MDDLGFLNGLTFIDTFFPSGGYAFSNGIESAVYHGEITSGKDLEPYLASWLREGVARSDGLAAAWAHRAAVRKEVSLAIEADRNLEAIKACREIREGSRQMGRQVLRIAAERTPDPLILEMKTRVERSETPGHYAVGMGLVLGAAGWPLRRAVSAYLFQSITGAVSAAMRLLPIGHREGQRVIHELLGSAAALIGEIEGLKIEEMSSWTPLHESRAMRHRSLDMKLFRS